MLIHDKRLAGRTPSKLAENNYEVDGNVPIKHMIDWVHSYARSQGGLDNLYIMCHGYEADWNLGDQTCTRFQVGGFGLAICAEGLDLTNASLMAALKGDIKTITIFACATAETGEGNEGTVAETSLSLAVAQGSAIAADHATAGGDQYSLTGGGVPLHGRREAGVDVGSSLRNDAELERRPRARARRHP